MARLRTMRVNQVRTDSRRRSYSCACRQVWSKVCWAMSSARPAADHSDRYAKDHWLESAGECPCRLGVPGAKASVQHVVGHLCLECSAKSRLVHYPPTTTKDQLRLISRLWAQWDNGRSLAWVVSQPS
jgi:hypothetical protein